MSDVSTRVAVETDAARGVAVIVSDAKQRWARGELPDATTILSEHPEIANDKSAVLDLAYEEYCLRCERGERIDCDQFCMRFSSLRHSLMRLLEVDRFFKDISTPNTGSIRPAFPHAGDRFLGFDFIDRIGTGAFAEVFLAAEHDVGGRLVVVKVSTLGTREASILGRLDHPAIVPIHSIKWDPASNLHAICMPFFGYATLADVLDRIGQAESPPETDTVLREIASGDKPTGHEQAIRPRQSLKRNESYVSGIVRMMAELTSGLAHAHGKGILHRDLKPSNILLTTDGRPMLLDFNLSTDIGIHAIGGTLPYMSPEQLELAGQTNWEAESCNVDERTDIFSLGCVFYELLSGRPPFNGQLDRVTSAALVDAALQSRRQGAVAITVHNPRVDSHLAAIVHRALAFDPNDRWSSATEIESALREWLRRRNQLLRWTGKHIGLVGLVAFFLWGSILLGIAAWRVAPPRELRAIHAADRLIQSGDLEDALERLSFALGARHGWDEALELRGIAYERLGKLELAADDFLTAIQAEPTAFRLAMLAHCRNKLGYHEQAVHFYQKAADAGLATPEVYNGLGYALLRLAEYQNAKQALENALSLQPAFPAALHNRAIAEMQSHMSSGAGEITLAFECIERAIRAGDTSGEAYYHAARICGLLAGNDTTMRSRGADYLRKAIQNGLDPTRLRTDLNLQVLFADDAGMSDKLLSGATIGANFSAERLPVPQHSADVPQQPSRITARRSL